MSRKKPGKKAMTEATELETKPVRLDLPPDIHRMLRLVAADDNLSMAMWARHCVEKTLKDEMKRRGFK